MPAPPARWVTSLAAAAAPVFFTLHAQSQCEWAVHARDGFGGKGLACSLGCTEACVTTRSTSFALFALLVAFVILFASSVSSSFVLCFCFGYGSVGTYLVIQFIAEGERERAGERRCPRRRLGG